MEKVRIQDDLYYHVNGEWLEKAVIPADRPTCGGFADLADDVEKTLLEDFKTMVKEEKYPNEFLKSACLLFKGLTDTKKRNKDGVKPIAKQLKEIANLKDIKAFNKKFTDWCINSYPLPIDFGVDADMKDSTHYCVMLAGPRTILPDTTYYKEGMEQQKEMMLGLWANMVRELLKCTKLEEEKHEEFIAGALRFDAIIATLVKSQEEWSNYIEMYNPFKASKVFSLVKPIKLKKTFEQLFGEIPEKVIVADPRFLKGFNTLFNEETFEDYKKWAYINLLLNTSSLLSEKMRDLSGMYQRALTGVQEAAKVEKFAYRLTSQIFSEPVGLYYGEKYFGEEAKKDVVEMVHEIIDTYILRMKKNDFLSEETKAKAIIKLQKMEIKMGYPNKVSAKYNEMVYDETKSLVENMAAFKRVLALENLSRLKKTVDRTEWVMPGHMVNACYNPSFNDITFPAAILQAPFYSIKQTRSENLGGIGAVIGHEISHAFDNNGAKCDENGNLNNWWTKEDFKKFTQRTKAMIKEFDGIELPWGKVNGAFTVSENIADNGGMGVTLEIMSKMKDANYEEYFKNWARVWCMKAKDEYLQLLIRVDVHGPAYLRANMQPRNFPEWYKTFNVKKTDKMYLPESKRVSIW